MLDFFRCKRCESLCAVEHIHRCFACSTFLPSFDQWFEGALYCTSCFADDQAQHAQFAQGGPDDASRINAH